MDILVRKVDLWRARRELAALVWKRNELMRVQLLLQQLQALPTQAQEDLPTRCMQLMRQHPELAQEAFPCRDTAHGPRMYPFFLLITGASLECLREAHDMFSHAVSSQVTGNFGQRGYPLHTACGMTSEDASDDIIIFLAKAYQPAVYSNDSIGCLPIHILLNRNRNRVPTVAVVETLLDLYHEYTGRVNKYMGMSMESFLANSGMDGPSTMDILTSGCIEREDMINGLREPLALAIKNPQVSKDVLELLVRRFRSDGKFLLLGRVAKYSDEGGTLGYILGQETNYTMTLDHVRAISKLFPRLETLCCPAKAWEALAFNELVDNLCRKECSITDLTIRLPHCPPTAAGNNNLSLCSDSLQQLLVKNATLEQLHISFSAVSSVDQMKSILKCLFKGLGYNQGIKKLRLSGGHPLLFSDHIARKEFPGFWPAMSHLLQEKNAVLEDVFVDGIQPKASTKSICEVIYWTTLNRLGRAFVRSPSFTIHHLVSLLESISRGNRLDVIFGFLGENPSLWSKGDVVKVKHVV